MSERKMVQWAPGSKPQRMTRVLDEEGYRRAIDKALRNSLRGIPKFHRFNIIKPGDMVLSGDQLYTAGEVDYQAESVMLGIHKYGMNAVKRIPDWAVSMINYVLTESRKIEFDFRVEVIEVKKEPHPNATDLSIVQCFGRPVVIRSEDFQDGVRAAYVPPDSRILSLDPYYLWLGREKRRVRARKFRGVKSYGFLAPVDQGFPVGVDVQAFLEICHYKSTEPRNP